MTRTDELKRRRHDRCADERRGPGGLAARRLARRAVAAFLAGAALGACSALAPVRDTSRYYVLNSVGDADHDRAEPPAPELIVGLGPVAIPQYLDRPDIVARAGAHQIVPIPNARWGEPLQPNLARVLAEDVSAHLGTGEVVVFPWFGAVQPLYAVAVDVQRFELQEDGVVRLHARWTLRHLRGAAPNEVREVTISEPANHTDAASTAAAMSLAVAKLSENIVAAIRTAHQTSQTKARTPSAPRASRTTKHPRPPASPQ